MGLTRLATETARKSLSISQHLISQVTKKGTEAAYITLRVDAQLGRKVSAFYLRDLVWLADLEEQIPLMDRMFIQPVDIWVRRLARLLWPKYNTDRLDDLLVARKLSSECHRYQVSDVALNQGAWYFGSQQVGVASRFRADLLKAAKSGV